jgi:hypothetical protein
MPKVHDPIPSRTFSIAVVGDDLDTLTEIVNEARRLKPEWHDTPQTILLSIVEDFLGLAEPFDQFVLTRVDSEQRALLRQIAELKSLKRAVRTGTLDGETPNGADEEAPPSTAPATRPDKPATPPPLGSASPAVR